MGNKCQSQQPHVLVIRANFGARFKDIWSMDLPSFISRNTPRNWCSTSIFYLPNGKIINKWETNASLNGPTCQLCAPTLDQGSRIFSQWIQRNLFHGIPSGTGIPPPYSSLPTMQIGNKSHSQWPHVTVMCTNFGPMFKDI